MAGRDQGEGASGNKEAAAGVTALEIRVLVTVLSRVLRGQPVNPPSLSVATGLTPAEIDAALATLHEAGAIYLADGAVVAAYPLSLRPARYRINMGTAMIFANCAVDALAVSSMVDEPADIISDCVHCGAAILVRMKGTRVLAA